MVFNVGLSNIHIGSVVIITYPAHLSRLMNMNVS